MMNYDALPIADVLREHIQEDRVAQLTVSSNSMAPLLRSGDVIGLGYADRSHIEDGRIVTFNDPGASPGLTTHRIAVSWPDDQGNLQILTRGDQILFFDPPWEVEAIVGQVVWRERNGRKMHFDRGPGQWLSKQLGLIAEQERALISGLPLEKLRLTPEGIAFANNQARLRRKGIFPRLGSLAYRSWRGILAFIIPIFARQEDSAASRGTR